MCLRIINLLNNDRLQYYQLVSFNNLFFKLSN